MSEEDKERLQLIEQACNFALQQIADHPLMKGREPLGAVFGIQLPTSSIVHIVVAKMEDTRVQLKILDTIDAKLRSEIAAHKVRVNTKRGSYGSDA